MVGGAPPSVVVARARAFGALATCVAVALVVALAGPASGAIEEDREAFIEVADDLATTSEELEAVDVEADEAGARLIEARQRLTDEKQRLAELRAKLREATARQQVAEARLGRMVQALGQAIRALVSAQAALAEHSADFETEITAAYKYGGDSTRLARTLEALEESGNLSEFLIIEEQLRHGAKNRHDVVVYVTDLAAQLTQREEEVAELRDRAAAAERIAQQHRDEVAALTRQQAGVVRQITAQRSRIAALVRELKKRQRDYEERVAELEAESERLAAELAEYTNVAGALGEDDLMWPTDGGVTSGFGWRKHPIFKIRRLHAGVDIPAPTGQTVYAAADGTVLSAGVRGGYGNAVVIQHDGVISTLYGHLSEIDVSTGDTVERLEQIGEIGSTGNSTGPHLHFEVRVGGAPYDPMSWFD